MTGLNSSAENISEFPRSALGPQAAISEPNFRLLIENAADGIIVVDLAGAVLYANVAAAEIFGKHRDDLVHVPLGRPLASGETTEIAVVRPDGYQAAVEMRVVEVTWDQRPALLASLRDVSVQRAQEERRRQSQKLEAIGQLTAGITHDFKNVLAVIESGLRLLQNQLIDDHADSKTNMLIEELLKRTQNGAALAQQLLAFSRQQPLSPEIVDLNARIESLTSLLEQTLGSGIKIERLLDPSLAKVLIDINQFDVAILNLAVNARDAMASNGRLTIETNNASRELQNSLGTADPLVRITVKDTGCGMSKEMLSRAFEPFFTTKPDGKGTGLGLSQVYGFITQSGGSIRLESDLGKGTSVHLYLPSAPQS